MMFEIGSEFWTGCTPLDGNGVKELLPYEMDAQYTLCGRTALELVLRDVLQYGPVRKAYLPSYCCHTMIEPFVSKGIEVVFYDVYFTDSGIGWDIREDNDCSLVFLMDYFGFQSKETARTAARQKALGKWVVYDATHSLFCESTDYSAYDYVFGSFRKWFGVNAGFWAKRGVGKNFPALTENRWYSDVRNEAFLKKQKFIAGYPVEKDAFLQAFSWAEERLETDYRGYAPDEASLCILESVNVEFIRRKRRENAAFVIKAVHNLEQEQVISPYQTVREGECPLFVPLQVDPSIRTDLRRKLIENRVYLPIHWPLSGLHKADDVSLKIYNEELSFVCDQRYGRNDIERAIELIRSF